MRAATGATVCSSSTQGNLPAHRIGRLWKIKISEVDAWVRAARAGADRDDLKKT
jgi:hypothetical protein